jgi:hypothetical protein
MDLNDSPIAPAISPVPPPTIADAREPPSAPPPGGSHLRRASGTRPHPPLEFVALPCKERKLCDSELIARLTNHKGVFNFDLSGDGR